MTTPTATVTTTAATNHHLWRSWTCGNRSMRNDDGNRLLCDSQNLVNRQYGRRRFGSSSSSTATTETTTPASKQVLEDSDVEVIPPPSNTSKGNERSKTFSQEQNAMAVPMDQDDNLDQNHGEDNDEDNDDYNDNGDDKDDDLAIGIREWLESTFSEEGLSLKEENEGSESDSNRRRDEKVVYGRLIDLARLTAEFAYDRNGALVGAMAEAGGDDGAAERWLRGFLVMLQGTAAQSNFPTWWWEHDAVNEDGTNDRIDDDDNNPHHQALLSLARNRNEDFFIKRCVDRQVLKKRWDLPDYTFAEMMSEELLQAIVKHGRRGKDETYNDDGEEQDDAAKPDLIELDPQALDKAVSIWGEETMEELCRKSPDELEADEMENSGMIKKVTTEEGEWWGPASDAEPQQAYGRLIDAARYGSMMAYDRQMQYIGSIADVMEAQSQPHLGAGWDGFGDDDDANEDETNEDDANEDETNDEDDSDSSDDDEEEGNDQSDHSGGEEDSDSSSDEEDENTESEDKNDADVEKEPDLGEGTDADESSTGDTRHTPTEVGPNARQHLEKFLEELKKENMMPPWWNEQHEESMWRLACDMEGQHCLAYPLDGEDLKELYDDSVRQKVGLMAEAAMQAENPTGDSYSGLDEDGGGMPDFMKEHLDKNNGSDPSNEETEEEKDSTYN